MIELLDLKKQYAAIREQIQTAITEVLEDQRFLLGPRTKGFEENFAEMHGLQHGIGCSNGTSAIVLALQALGIQPGDEVITTPHTFIASASAIINAGGVPVFVDIDPETYTMDARAIEGKITKKTKGIVPVHIYGNPCDMDAIKAIAQKHQLFLVEDCAQAHLARYGNLPVGSSGTATFSFYPGKNLGAYGDAGIVLTNNAEHAAWMRASANHGRTKDSGKYLHAFIGSNQRIDELQAAILQVKLPYLNAWTESRRRIAQIYDESIRKKGFKTIKEQTNGLCVYHQYVVEVSNRNELMSRLTQEGIASGIHYPVPLHMQPAFKHLGYQIGDFPRTEQAAERVISLPISPDMDDSEIAHVVSVFTENARL